MSVKGKIALLEHIDKPSYKYVFQSKQCDIVKKFQQIKRDVCRVVIPKPLQRLSEAYGEDRDWNKWNFRILEDVEESECSDKIQQMKRLSSKLKERCYYHCLRDGVLNRGKCDVSRVGEEVRSTPEGSTVGEDNRVEIESVSHMTSSSKRRTSFDCKSAGASKTELNLLTGCWK